jgi:hypothetical protein
MGYLITAGTGLALGLGLLVWALRLQGKLKDAQDRQAVAERTALNSSRIADENRAAARASEAAATRVSKELAEVKLRLQEARSRLIASKDPAVIKEFLDAELKAEEV